jgi:hypothetical protein
MATPLKTTLHTASVSSYKRVQITAAAAASYGLYSTSLLIADGWLPSFMWMKWEMHIQF